MLRQENTLTHTSTSSTSILKKLQEVRPIPNEIAALKKGLLIAAIVLQQFEAVSAEITQKPTEFTGKEWWIPPVAFFGLIFASGLCYCACSMLAICVQKCSKINCCPTTPASQTQTNGVIVSEEQDEAAEKTPVEHEIIIPMIVYSTITSSSSSSSDIESSIEEDSIVPTLQKRIDELEIIVPERFICPVTHEIMSHPCITDDGHNYESSVLERLKRDQAACPQNPLLQVNLIQPNYDLRSEILEFVEKAERENKKEIEAEAEMAKVSPSSFRAK